MTRLFPVYRGRDNQFNQIGFFEVSADTRSEREVFAINPFVPRAIKLGLVTYVRDVNHHHQYPALVGTCLLQMSVDI